MKSCFRKLLMCLWSMSHSNALPILGFLFLFAACQFMLNESLLPAVPRTLLTVDLFYLGYGLLLLGLALPPPAGGAFHLTWGVRAFWESRLLRVVGRMCFSLYAWQANVFLMNLHTPEQLQDWRTVAATFSLLFVLSGLTYRFVEFPHKSTAELFS